MEKAVVLGLGVSRQSASDALSTLIVRYAELLAANGRLGMALEYLEMVPGEGSGYCWYCCHGTASIMQLAACWQGCTVRSSSIIAPQLGGKNSNRTVDILSSDLPPPHGVPMLQARPRPLWPS